MEFVSESIIDTLIEKYEHDSNVVEDVELLNQENRVILDFIHSDRLDLLTEKEQGVMQFMTLVLYFSARTLVNKPLFIQGNLLEDWEEQNWESWNTNIKTSISRAMDTFFDQYNQEDLLAFVEDTLQPDEESDISPAGAEIMLVTAKSIIDTIDQLN